MPCLETSEVARVVPVRMCRPLAGILPTRTTTHLGEEADEGWHILEGPMALFYELINLDVVWINEG